MDFNFRVSSAGPRRVASEPGGTCATWAGLVRRGDYAQTTEEAEQALVWLWSLMPTRLRTQYEVSSERV